MPSHPQRPDLTWASLGDRDLLPPPAPSLPQCLASGRRSPSPTRSQCLASGKRDLPHTLPQCWASGRRDPPYPFPNAGLQGEEIPPHTPTSMLGLREKRPHTLLYPNAGLQGEENPHTHPSPQCWASGRREPHTPTQYWASGRRNPHTHSSPMQGPKEKRPLTLLPNAGPQREELQLGPFSFSWDDQIRGIFPAALY